MPNDWDCMIHQSGLWDYLDKGGRRAVAVWHRRAGKDSTSLNYTATEAMETTGVYWHMLPTQKQARKVVWDGIDRNGRRMIDQVFPQSIRKAKREQEMQIELKSGSIWQLCGSDNYDSLVGANPKGVVFSEWSLCDPKAWDFIRPILAENGGWAIFIYTARGKNHGYSMAQMAEKNPNWHYSKLTVEDTTREDGSPVITQEAIQEDRESGMSEDMIQQEYYCSFDVAIPGAYFSKEIAACRADKRIGFVPIEPMLQVHTFWDLGISDSMTIWFVQAIGKEIRLINYYENNNEGMGHYIRYLDTFKSEHHIEWGEHYAPHDIEVRELMSGKSRRDTAVEMGINFRVVPQHSVMDGIEAVRRIFPRMWFDDKRCELGVACVASYHREWDDKHQRYKDAPVHDWASHGADALRQMGVAWSEILTHDVKPMPTAVMNHDFDVF
jgi:phage terminase large subunit